jgi:hypothetical protein
MSDIIPSTDSLIGAPLLSDERPGSGELLEESTSKFPFEAFETEKPEVNNPTVSVKDPWMLQPLNVCQDVSGYPDPPEGAEIFPLDTPDCVSSLGRKPLDYFNIVYEAAQSRSNGVEVGDSCWNKFSGHGVVGIFPATTNHINQPEDLSNNWTASNASATLGDQTVNGMRLYKVTQSAAGGYISNDNVNVSNNGQGYAILKNGNIPAGETAKINMNGYASCQLTVDFVNQTVTGDTYLAIWRENWIDDDTVEIYWYISGAVDAVTTTRIHANTAGSANDYIYAGMIFLGDDVSCISPYVRLGRQECILDYPFALTSGKFSFGFWFYPLFNYDIGTYPIILCFKSAATHNFQIYYDSGQFSAAVKGASNSRVLQSQEFDDGSSHDTLNQWLYIAGAIDPTTESTAGSWFKVYGDDGVDATADEEWNAALDAYVGWSNILSIGREGAGGEDPATGWFNDFIIIDDTLWTEAEADNYFSGGVPWKISDRLLGKNSNWCINANGDAFFRRVFAG